MKTARQCRAGWAGVVVAALLAGCSPYARVAPAAAPMTDLQAGMPAARPQIVNPYEGNVHAINEGKRLYNRFNCVGCHAAGGGSSGPALMDDKWIYGSEPANIFATIVEGRPAGMPAFRGKIPESDVWKITAYVRSLSGLGTRLPESMRNQPLQEEASGNIEKGPKELKKYYKEAMDGE